MINAQFKLERVVYCQDGIYGEYLKNARTKVPTVSFTAVKQCSLEEMIYHLKAYFRVSFDLLCFSFTKLHLVKCRDWGER